VSKIVLKNARAFEKMRIAGRLLGFIVASLENEICTGMSSANLDALVEKKMRMVGLVPVCIGYHGYRHATCISVNDVVIHGVPSASVIFKSGDCVKVDVVGSYQGYCVDMARTFFVGLVSDQVRKMRETAQLALDEAIAMVKPGVMIGSIAARIQEIVEAEGFGVVRAFAGHGIGRNIHEGPEVPNFGKKETGFELVPGVALAIEPMVTQFAYDVFVDSDGWSVKTVDRGMAVHVEDTVILTDSGVEILTRCVEPDNFG
jgi:methionyl aminopeptidase